jgi:hypothetical protein
MTPGCSKARCAMSCSIRPFMAMAGHVVERDHAHQRAAVQHRHVALMALQHHATHFIHAGLGGTGERSVVHHAAHQARAHAAAAGHHRRDHLAEGEHAHHVAMLHHDQRADVELGHGLRGFGQGLIGGEDRFFKRPFLPDGTPPATH